MKGEDIGDPLERVEVGVPIGVLGVPKMIGWELPWLLGVNKSSDSKSQK
jgi:hypothetical protein